jgi:hypothetical protein
MINLTKLFTTAVSSAALAAISLVSPISASALGSSTQTTYTTALTQVQPVSAPGEFDGTLKLTVTADGIVNGYYFPADEGTIVPVVGGEQNGQYWMDIGGNTRLHIYAKLGKDGSLVGTATPTPYALNMGHEELAETYSFVAKLSTN